MYLSVPAPYGGNWNRRSWRNVSQFQSRLHEKDLISFEMIYSFAGFWISVQAALWVFLFVGLHFTCFSRQQTDFAVCGQRRGLCPSTPQAFPGKRLERNPLPWGLFVRFLFYGGVLLKKSTSEICIISSVIVEMPKRNFRPVCYWRRRNCGLYLICIAVFNTAFPLIFQADIFGGI